MIDLPIPDDDGEKPSVSDKKTSRRKKTAAQPSLFDKLPDGPDPAHIAAVTTLLEFKKSLTCADVESEFKLETAKARAVLKHLIDTGIVSIDGKGKTAKYRLRS